MSSTLSSLSTMFSTLSSLSTMASTLSSGLRLSTTLSVSVFSVLRRARKTAVFFSVSAATLFFFPFLFSALRFTAVFSPASSPPPFFSSLVPSLSTMSSRLSSGLRLSTTLSVSVFSVLRRARKTAVFFSVSAATLFFFPFLFSALRFTAVFSPASSPPPFFSSLVPSLSTMSSRLSSGLRLSTTFSVFAVLPFTPAFLTSFFLEASFGVSV